MNHPRLRQRVETVHVQFSPNQNLTNTELLEQFVRYQKDKLADATLQGYAGSLRDAIQFNTDPNTGRELPLRAWTKETLWGYLVYAQNNYCAYFRPAPFGTGGAMCHRKVWVAIKAIEHATQQHCRDCKLFKPPTMDHRVNALSSFFKFLHRIGIVQYNYCRDVVDEYWDERPDAPHYEKRRNPTLDEERRLVNQTAHPRNRFVYAATAKWWLRPNELFMLDRYASFGLPLPQGRPMPRGFDNGFLAHPHLPSWTDGGDLVYIPEKVAENGAKQPEKRGGNRWLVVDEELRPIAEQYFAWWERTVRRDENGLPVTTCLILTDAGNPLEAEKMYDVLFYADCERLGLMLPGDRANPLRRWSAHCQRHFGQRLSQMLKFPSDWNHHFRGDKIPGARAHYFYPLPEEVRQVYRELVPKLGFTPLPDAARFGASGPDEAAAHRLALVGAIEALTKKSRRIQVKCMEVVEVEDGHEVNSHLAAVRHAGSVAYAFRVGNPGKSFLVRRNEETHEAGRALAKSVLLGTYRRALAHLGGPPNVATAE